jgi:hypothetical protein
VLCCSDSPSTFKKASDATAVCTPKCLPFWPGGVIVDVDEKLAHSSIVAVSHGGLPSITYEKIMQEASYLHPEPSHLGYGDE